MKARLTALLVDDERLARAELRRMLAAHPEIEVAGEAGDVAEAEREIARLSPDVVFLDIRMPGLTGMEVAERLAGRFRVVFVTAYDQYAVEAFEKQALDYLLKPISEERLKKTIDRLKGQIALRKTPVPDLAEIVRALVDDARGRGAIRYLQWIKASHREGVRIIPVEEVCYLQAKDKYTAVVTQEGEFLIRKPVRELVAELDPDRFWQIHRGTIVNASCVAGATRFLTGRLALRLKNRPETLVVSRAFAERFRQM